MFLANFFSYSFRPFFLLGSLYALLGMLFWILAWTQVIQVQWQRVPAYWHGHEMFMGLAGAAIGGFLLTAVANWTRRPAVSGWPLVLLCLAWLTGRLSLHSPMLTATADLVYWAGLWLLLANEIIRASNSRNYKILLLLALIAGCDAFYHLAELGLANPALQRESLRMLLWLIILLIHVIGGRVIPAFTGNWLKRHSPSPDLPAHELPAGFGPADFLALVTLLLFALSTVLAVPALLAVVLGSLACAMQVWRLLRWKFWKTFSDPLVWMMHLAYLWIPAGMALWTLSLAGLLTDTAAIHALTIGAVASMIVSIGSRAALGHTGRPLHSHPLLTCSIILLSVSALLRVSAVLWPSQTLLGLSAAAWILAFLCFAVRYTPILVKLPINLLLILVLGFFLQPFTMAQNSLPAGPLQSEFHFTRLAFGVSGRAFTTQRGEPWLRDFPEAEYHFMEGVRRLTRLDADGEYKQVSLLDDALFDYPFLYAVKVGFWNLQPQEVDRLREYLLRGGTIMVDDFHGPNDWSRFAASIRRVFTDRQIMDIPDDHPIFHVQYQLDDRVQIGGINAVRRGVSWEHPQGIPEYWRAITDDDGRIMVIINFNMDLGDAWEHADDPGYPEPLTAMAYRIGINYIIYSITH